MKNQIRFLVKFETGFEKYVQLSNLQRGSVIDPLYPTVVGKGFVGIGAYSRTKSKTLYQLWVDMLKRCYSPLVKAIRPSYLDCEVSDGFKNLQVFAAWCENQIGFGLSGFQLDKDLLLRGNKTYSAETCCFLPLEVNGALITNGRKRDNKRTPIGVTLVKVSGKTKYLVSLSKNKLLKRYGHYDDQYTAFKVYKTEKEAYLKELANKWKDHIDPRAYNALMSYEVSIDD